MLPQEACDILHFLRINTMTQSLIGLELNWRASSLKLPKALLSIHILYLQLASALSFSAYAVFSFVEGFLLTTPSWLPWHISTGVC